MFALAAVVGVAGALWATATRGSTLSQAPGHALMGLALALMAVMAFSLPLLAGEKEPSETKEPAKETAPAPAPLTAVRRA